jgi:hypothetical protein
MAHPSEHLGLEDDRLAGLDGDTTDCWARKTNGIRRRTPRPGSVHGHGKVTLVKKGKEQKGRVFVDEGDA